MKQLFQNLFSRWPLLATLAAVLFFLLLAAVASYSVPSCERQRIARDASLRKTEHTASQAKGEAEHTDYRIDSATLATEGRFYQHRDSTLAQSEREILSTRHPRLILPAAEQLPREGAN